jgi:hypothetical protein
MRYYVNAHAQAGGNGSELHPFTTIQQAADVARAGDEVLVLPGIYRENVNPRHGGTATAPISYRSVEPLAATITGADELSDWAELTILNSEQLGMAFEPEQRFEQPDGSDIVFDEDILGEKRTIKTVAGPFANWGKANRLVY